MYITFRFCQDWEFRAMQIQAQAFRVRILKALNKNSYELLMCKNVIAVAKYRYM
jgi:hypothetical protein